MTKRTPTSKLIKFPRRKITAEELTAAVLAAQPLARIYKEFVKGYCARAIRKVHRNK